MFDPMKALQQQQAQVAPQPSGVLPTAAPAQPKPPAPAPAAGKSKVMQQLVDEMAGKEDILAGQALQEAGAQTMMAPKNYQYLPGGKLVGQGKDWRNMLAGSLQGHWGRKKVQQGMQAQAQAAVSAQDAQVASFRKLAKISGMTDAQAEAWAEAKALGADVDLNAFVGAKGSEEALKRAERGAWLDANPDVRQQIGPDAANKFWMTGNWDSGKGMSLVMSPDGTIRFSEGGETLAMDPTGTVDTEQQQALLNADDTADTLEYIMSAGGEDFLGYGPRIKGWLGGQIDKFGGSDEELAQFAAERSAWANQILQRVMEYRKMITGVAGGPAEMAKIEAIIANPKMGAAEFQAAIREEIKAAQRDANLVRKSRGVDQIDWPEPNLKWGRQKDVPEGSIVTESGAVVTPVGD